MKKHGSKVFLAIAIILSIAILAACSSTQSAPQVQFEDPGIIFPTAQELQQYEQPYLIQSPEELESNSTQPQSTGNCSSGRDGNRIWVEHIDGKSFSIEFISLLDPTMLVLPEIGSGDAVRREFSVGNDFISMDISPSNMSASGQPFIKFLCYESAMQFLHVQNSIYNKNGLYYYVLQEEKGKYNDAYLLLLQDEVKIISVETIMDLKFDPINRRPNGTATPQP